MLPSDILEKINTDFPEDKDFIKGLIKDFSVNEKHRVIRCILYLVKGNIDEFDYYCQTDYRDIIMCAEYEHPSLKRVRDFNKTFKENGT